MSEPAPDYQASPELVEYVEQKAEANLADRLRVAAATRAEGNLLLGLLLAGAGGSLGLGATLGLIDPFGWPLLAMAAYLFSVATVLSLKVIAGTPYPTAGNEPDLMLGRQMPLSVNRAREVVTLQARIDQAAYQNEQRSRWLERCRLAACATPIVGLLAYLAGS
jgi:hypothetical protein